MDKVEIDEIGAPVASEWFLKAFGSGEATKRKWVDDALLYRLVG